MGENGREIRKTGAIDAPAEVAYRAISDETELTP
jgi:hypothetical protein